MNPMYIERVYTIIYSYMYSVRGEMLYYRHAPSSAFAIPLYALPVSTVRKMSCKNPPTPHNARCYYIYLLL